MATDLDLLSIATDGIQTGIDVFGTPVIPITTVTLGYIKPEPEPEPVVTAGPRRGGRSSSNNVSLGKKRVEPVVYDLRVSAKIANINKKQAAETKKVEKTYRYAKDTAMEIRTLKLVIDRNKSNPKVVIENIDTSVFVPKIVVETTKITVETKGSITVSSSIEVNRTPKITIRTEPKK